jgi:hypothetical protein
MGGTCNAYGGRRGVYRISVGKPEERDHFGDQGVDGSIILRWILKRWNVGVWTGSSCHSIGQVAGTFGIHILRGIS